MFEDMKFRKASEIENKIIHAIYDIRSRRVEAFGEMTLLLGPDEADELLKSPAQIVGTPPTEFLGFRVCVVSTPGISFAWPLSAIEEVRHESKQTEMKEEHGTKEGFGNRE